MRAPGSPVAGSRAQMLPPRWLAADMRAWSRCLSYRSLTSGPRLCTAILRWQAGSRARIEILCSRLPSLPCGVVEPATPHAVTTAEELLAPGAPQRVIPGPCFRKGSQVHHIGRRRRRRFSAQALGLAGAEEMDPMVVFEVRPRMVWGRRPRVNGGRRRPRGWMGRFKLRPVASRPSYPNPAPSPPLPALPRLEELPQPHFEMAPPTGNPIVDTHITRLSTLCGGIAAVRGLLLARAQVFTTSGKFRVETMRCWKKHDELLTAAVALRALLIADYGVEVPELPVRFFSKF